MSVELLNYCFLCLKKCSSESEVITVIADGVICGILAQSCSQTLTVTEFDNIWSYVGRKLGSRVEKFSNVPQICSGCSGVVLTVQNLLKLLDSEIERLKLILTESVSSTRCRELVEELKGAVIDVQVTQDTIKVLEELGHAPIKEEHAEEDIIFLDGKVDSGKICSFLYNTKAS